MLALPLALSVTQVRAEVFNTIDFPAGAESFVDVLLRFDPDLSGVPPAASHPLVTLGVPTTTFQSLGSGGLIELRFVDNLLTNSHDFSADLYVGEAQGTAEDFLVALRPTLETKALLSPADDADGDGYFELGRFIGVPRVGAFGFVRTIDIDQVFPLQRHQLLKFDAIQIMDDPIRGEDSGNTVGVDLESVGAISSMATGVILQAGDTDDDGDVDLIDLNNVRNNFGGQGLGDTLPFDGVVDLGDLNNVRNNFGEGGANAVPEPPSLFLLFASAAGLVALRRHRLFDLP